MEYGPKGAEEAGLIHRLGSFRQQVRALRQKNRHTSETLTSPGPHELAIIVDRCGIHLSDAQVSQLWTYHQLLRQHNPELNLTRIHNFSNMALKLYVDSLLPGILIELPSPLLDLGTGPGMPGIPLKIANPRIEILLAESRQNRVSFLEKVLQQLQMENIHVVAGGISRGFDHPVAGVITRAVEDMTSTLHRVHGCLDRGGLAIFMKGPRCDAEIEEAQARLEHEFELVDDRHYLIPGTSHRRRLVVFRRMSAPPRLEKIRAMERYIVRKIESEQNELFRNLKKLLTGRGIRKLGKALVAGQKVTKEVLEDFGGLCEGWISVGDDTPPPPASPPETAWYQVSKPLFAQLDVFGTGAPLLVVRLPEMDKWEPSRGLGDGCTLLIPFQDPENVGAVVRSAAALGVNRIVFLEESAHPFHPKALRASGGAVFRVKLLEGPSLRDLPEDLPIVPLSSEGSDIGQFEFPDTFAFLPGMEGPGLPERWRKRAVSIPILPRVESLNAATATGIALYEWSRAQGRLLPRRGERP